MHTQARMRVYASFYLTVRYTKIRFDKMKNSS
jgi:hypothetical protein